MRKYKVLIGYVSKGGGNTRKYGDLKRGWENSKLVHYEDMELFDVVEADNYVIDYDSGIVEFFRVVERNDSDKVPVHSGRRNRVASYRDWIKVEELRGFDGQTI